MTKILALLCAGVLMAAFRISYAELPPPTPEQKAAAKAKAEKDAAEKEKAKKDVARAQDKAVANYRKNKGSAAGGTTDTQAAPQQESSARKTEPPQQQGADHANARHPDSELTREEAQTGMPKPGQVNDYSTTARDPQNSSGRK